jgi:hypothetical protein
MLHDVAWSERDLVDTIAVYDAALWIYDSF